MFNLMPEKTGGPFVFSGSLFNLCQFIRKKKKKEYLNNCRSAGETPVQVWILHQQSEPSKGKLPFSGDAPGQAANCCA